MQTVPPPHYTLPPVKRLLERSPYVDEDFPVVDGLHLRVRDEGAGGSELGQSLYL